MMTQLLTPGMEHGEETDASAETTSIGGDLHQGFRYGTEQQVVKQTLVSEGNGGHGLGQGEDDMRVGHGQQRGSLTVYRRAGSDAWSECSGMRSSSGSSILKPGNCCESTSVRSGAGIASRSRIYRHDDRGRFRNCCCGPNAQALRSQPSVTTLISTKGSSACAAFKAFSPWSKSTVRLLRKMPVPQP